MNLLRDLRLALAQGDGRAAQDRLDALRETGSLSRENLRFLQVELLARFERWPELVSLPYFAELEKVRRPRRVSELMLEALWHIEVLRSGRPPDGGLPHAGNCRTGTGRYSARSMSRASREPWRSAISVRWPTATRPGWTDCSRPPSRTETTWSR